MKVGREDGIAWMDEDGGRWLVGLLVYRHRKGQCLPQIAQRPSRQSPYCLSTTSAQGHSATRKQCILLCRCAESQDIRTASSMRTTEHRRCFYVIIIPVYEPLAMIGQGGNPATSNRKRHLSSMTRGNYISQEMRGREVGVLLKVF